MLCWFSLCKMKAEAGVLWIKFGSNLVDNDSTRQAKKQHSVKTNKYLFYKQIGSESRNFCLLRFYYTHLWQSRAQCLNDRPRFLRILFAWKPIWKLCQLSLKICKNKDGSKQGNSNPRNRNFSADKIKGKLYLIKKLEKHMLLGKKKFWTISETILPKWCSEGRVTDFIESCIGSISTFITNFAKKS